jgi:hypothetical protein
MDDASGRAAAGQIPWRAQKGPRRGMRRRGYLKSGHCFESSSVGAPRFSKGSCTSVQRKGYCCFQRGFSPGKRKAQR